MGPAKPAVALAAAAVTLAAAALAQPAAALFAGVGECSPPAEREKGLDPW